jgi:hypothetical protein
VALTDSSSFAGEKAMSDSGMEPAKHAPGSPEAVAQGCTCSTTLNRHGEGTRHGEPRFYYDRKCPVHRIDAAKRAKEAGEMAPR